MQYKKLIQSEIDFTKTFRLIAQAYEEIAVMKMRKVRASVLQAREYFEKLSEVFADGKAAKERLKKEQEKKTNRNKKLQTGENLSILSEQIIAQKSIAALAKMLNKKYSATKATSVKLNRTVSVFLSANTTLYGDIIQRIFKFFIADIKKKETDVIIIGRLGRRLYEELENKKPYLYFEIPDFEVNLENLKPVIFHIVKYKTIMVYYGKFENVVNQQAVVSNISGDQPFTLKEDKKSEVRPEIEIKFLFEPSLDSILAFFEDLITSSLFRQTVYETQLARWASRIMAMEKAQVNIENQIKRLKFLETKINRIDQQKKQLERFSGISLWRNV